MRSRTEIIADQKAFGAGGGNSLVLEVLMDIRFLLVEQRDSLNMLTRLIKDKNPKKGYFEKLREKASDGKE